MYTQVHSGAQEYANAFLTEEEEERQPVKEVLLLKEAYRLVTCGSQTLIPTLAINAATEARHKIVRNICIYIHIRRLRMCFAQLSNHFGWTHLITTSSYSYHLGMHSWYISHVLNWLTGNCGGLHRISLWSHDQGAGCSLATALFDQHSSFSCHSPETSCSCARTL